MKHVDRSPKVEVVKLLAVTHVFGQGIETDPSREVTTFYSFEGEIVVHSDPWKIAQQKKEGSK